MEIYELSNKLLEQLKSKVKEIKEAVEEFDLNSTLQIELCINTEPEVSTPAIGFGCETLTFLSQIKANIDIDTCGFKQLANISRDALFSFDFTCLSYHTV